jgi:hypothetical protein
MLLEYVNRTWIAARRRPRVAVAFIAAVLIAAYASWPRSSGEVPDEFAGALLDIEQASAGFAAASVPAADTAPQPAWSIGSPADAPPEALPTPEGGSDAAASTLARLVSAGGEDGLRALLTAVRMAGFSVYGAGDTAVVSPDNDQGLHFEAWQVRAMAGSVGTRYASVPLTKFADALAAASPALREQPVARLLLDDIVRASQVDDSTVRFWARFIIELGKHAPRGAPFDLLTQRDASVVRLNTIQVSLIVARLTADAATATGADITADNASRSVFSLPVVYADAPCAPAAKRRRPKVTRTAFQDLVHTLTGPHRAFDRAVGPSLDNWGDYTNLMLMVSALKLDVEMEGGPLLKRTKTTRAGEQRRIRATLSLDSSALEWVACVRTWLTERNKDLRFPPRAPGPVPEVPIEFGLDGRGIVRIPLGGAGNERGLPGGTRTDGYGIARLAVEGEPQPRRLPETAKEERKGAATTVTAKVRPEHLLTRTHPTEGIASADFVHEWILDQEFDLDVAYPFEVMDWEDGPGRWTGTVELVETTITESSQEDARNAWTTVETRTTQATVQVNETVSEQSGDGIYASLKGDIRGTYNSLKTSSGWHLQLCRQHRKMSGTSRSSIHGEANGDATISVTIFADGAYLVGVTSNVNIPLEGEDRSDGEAFGPPPDCSITSKSTSGTLAPPDWPLSGLIQVSGKIDPKDPNGVSGSKTEEETPRNARGRTSRTTTWNLRRQ